MIKTPLTGMARPVTDSVKRAMGYLKDRPDPRMMGREPQPGEVGWRPQGHRR
ncbi:MAG TPA: hypothetical protein VHG30_04905 [Microvirga sp.]|nr:hypothetical protein [Microvirga sp.]